MKKILIGSLIIFSSLLHADINIAVAANLSYAIKDLKKEFNKQYPNVRVEVTLGGSGKLTAQIEHGGPYQIFMSADMKYPRTLYKLGFAITKPIVYAQGSLAYFSIKKMDFSRGIHIVESKNIDKIAVANPKTAPYGKATMEAMKNAKVYEESKRKFVYGESISQTVVYALKAADMGFVAKSLLYSPMMLRYKKSINWDDVNPKLYTPIDQGMVILKNAKDNSEAMAFYKFILGTKSNKILKKFGYLVP